MKNKYILLPSSHDEYEISDNRSLEIDDNVPELKVDDPEVDNEAS
ncbi:2808_t:CDS:2, partial [Ambispora gerdemannii]